MSCWPERLLPVCLSCPGDGHRPGHDDPRHPRPVWLDPGPSGGLQEEGMKQERFSSSSPPGRRLQDQRGACPTCSAPAEEKQLLAYKSDCESSDRMLGDLIVRFMFDKIKF